MIIRSVRKNKLDAPDDSSVNAEGVMSKRICLRGACRFSVTARRLPAKSGDHSTHVGQLIAFVQDVELSGVDLVSFFPGEFVDDIELFQISQRLVDGSLADAGSGGN